MSRSTQFPIRGMIFDVFENLNALTKEESDVFFEETPRPGIRAGGVGLVRIQDSRDIYWTVVRCNAIEVPNCKIHNEVMNLYKTTSESFFNQKNAIFLRCDVKCPSDRTEFVTCGFNSYPLYPLNRFMDEFNNQEDENLRPILFIDHRKVAAEDGDANCG